MIAIIRWLRPLDEVQEALCYRTLPAWPRRYGALSDLKEETMKNCIACKHFRFDSGWVGTEVTPGEAAVAECLKGHWEGPWGPMGMYENQDDLLAKTHRAETCPDYEVSDLAKSKGW